MKFSLGNNGAVRSESAGLLSHNVKSWYLISFLCGALPFLITAMPFVIQNGGVFYFYGDFNDQQVPFTIYLSEHLREMDLPQFDFNAGAGLDFFSAYLFYNLFSPFMFIYALFPDGAVIYAFTFVITLKLGVCALSAYIYSSRFCHSPEYAVVSAVLYTYSYSMITFSFHYLDALAFFPLMLAALEAAVVDKRRCVFGLAVMLCAFTNYYFFGMEVIFIVIYFLVRLTDEKFRINFKDFCCLGAESVLGTAAAGIAIVPAAAYIITSPRLGEPFQNIKDMLLYETPLRYARIFQSMFLMPDLQGYTNFFPDSMGEYPYGSRWSSLGMYLPLFGMSGVIAYALSNKKSWFTKLTAICIIIAVIPVFNSIFSVGSSIYYARWMFAPTLIMSVMTAMAIENNSRYFKAGIIVQVSAAVLITIFCIIFPIEIISVWKATIYSDAQKWTQIIGTLAGAAVTAAIIYGMKKDDSFLGKVLVLTVAAAAAFSEVTLLFGMGTEPYPESMSSTYPGELNAEISEGGRLMIETTLDNRNLLWEVPSVYTFNTTVSPYVSDFSDALGLINNDITKNYSAQCLLSSEERVKYAPPSESDNIESSSDFYEFRCIDGDMAYYKNKNFIPMGFCYEYCVSEEELMSLDKDERGKFMLKALVLEDVSEADGKYLSHLPAEELHGIDDEEFSEECAKRAEKTVSGYYTDDDSYNAETDFDEPELVFFSVAYDKGFTAYVDGEEVQVVKANLGFQAIPVPAGKHTIKCVYHSIPRDVGGIVSICGVIGLAIYSITITIFRKKQAA